ncbi:DUF4871 domain-containing protein [Paenibacillus lutrae]|uniref:DUF4871 domain-containing protein n=1 Tax=Paenibacillus lutrae TaxID=2078573 RepID=A0A7X3FEJ7_9BACL|nr:DUF4871 domain-containing protein [Paenibacillus lutrae]MVO98036.1 DUF4871 domain-containing protein [Paenibacillus lutrae]
MKDSEHLKLSWENKLRERPFRDSHFTEAIRSKVMQRTKLRKNKLRYAGAAVTLAGCLLAAGLYTSWDYLNKDSFGIGIVNQEDLRVRHSYAREGVELLNVYPDPYLEAGRRMGYMFSFTEPFTAFKGKSLAITAVHPISGTRLVVSPAQEVTHPSSGYEGLERYTTSFGLPFGGIWRYEIELDGQTYADVVLSVSEPSWEISPVFPYEMYTLRGKKGELGFIDAPFIAGRSQKYMWHLWNKGEAIGNFQVKAVKQGETKIYDIFTTDSPGEASSDRVHRIPSLMKLPEPGVWRLLPYADGQMVDSIVVEVK